MFLFFIILPLRLKFHDDFSRILHTFHRFLIFIICQGLVNFTWITFNIQFFFSLFKGFWKEQLWTVVHQLCKWNSAVFLQSVCLQNGTSEFGIHVLTRLCSKENSMEPSALKVWNPECPHMFCMKKLNLKIHELPKSKSKARGATGCCYTNLWNSQVHFFFKICIHKTSAANFTCWKIFLPIEYNFMD